MKALSSIPVYELNEYDYLRFSKLIQEFCGIVISKNRKPDLERAIFQTMKEKALSSVDDLFALLVDKKDNTKAYQALAEKITIGETSFLRNHFFFEALEKHILPEIIKHQSATKNNTVARRISIFNFLFSRTL